MRCERYVKLSAKLDSSIWLKMVPFPKDIVSSNMKILPHHKKQLKLSTVYPLLIKG